jgi:membrane fusion protein, multidrug efflux system
MRTTTPIPTLLTHPAHAAPPTNALNFTLLNPANRAFEAWGVLFTLTNAAIVVVALLLAGCGDAATAAQSPEMKPVRVVTGDARPAPVTRTVTFYGVTRSASRGALSFTVPGRLAKRPVEAGQKVKAGQVIAELDASQYVNAVAAATATLADIDANLEQLARDITRAEKLKSGAAASAEELEKVTTAESSLRAKRLAAEAQKAEAERMVRESRLVARVAGEVTAVMAQPGEFMGPGMPVVAFAATSGLEAEIDLPEAFTGLLHVGDVVTVRFPLVPEAKPITGTLTSVGEASPGIGRLFPALVSLATAPHALPGLTVEIVTTIPAEGGVLIPAAAVVNPTGQNPSAFVVEGGRALRKRLQLIRLAGADAIVKGELVVGAPVVTLGQLSLIDGDPVDVVAQQAATATASARTTP